MLISRVAVIAVCLISCIDARQPQPDAPDVDDAATDDVGLDAAPIVDAALVDSSPDAAPRCDAYMHQGRVYDCTVDLCSPSHWRDVDLWLACCMCDPALCPVCDIAG